MKAVKEKTMISFGTKLDCFKYEMKNKFGSCIIFCFFCRIITYGKNWNILKKHYVYFLIDIYLWTA